MVSHSQPQGAIRRGFRLGKLGLALAGSYLGYQLQDAWLGEKERAQRRRGFQERASRRLREGLESLRGPFMKFGQILSMQTHALPSEAINELANLQMRAPGMHPSLARARFKASLGKYPEEVFRRFEEERGLLRDVAERPGHRDVADHEGERLLVPRLPFAEKGDGLRKVAAQLVETQKQLLLRAAALVPSIDLSPALARQALDALAKGEMARGVVLAQQPGAPPPDQIPAQTLPPQQLDNLVAPIALYPDQLVAQILMASTYPLEIVEASRWLQNPQNAQLRGDQRPLEFGVVIAAEIVRHDLRPGERVHRLPGRRLEPQDREFQRQIVLVRVDEHVHAVREHF
jgi:hypothetical protein